MLLLCQYATTLSREKGPDLFLQSGPSQIFPGIDLVSIAYVGIVEAVLRKQSVQKVFLKISQN